MNFIIIFYEKKKQELKAKDDYCLKCQFDLAKLSTSRIRFLYPNSKIHLLTNLKEKINIDHDFAHICDMESNHLIKFNIYSLLDDKAIYVDNDVLLIRKFNDFELETKNDFKFFNHSSNIVISQICKYPHHATCYNAGVVYILKPNAKMTEDLFSIEDEFFKNKKKLIEKNIWPFNDEYSIAIYLNELKIKFEKSQTVNVFRGNIGLGGFDNFQSIHYTGIHNKKKYFQELKTIKSKKKFFI